MMPDPPIVYRWWKKDEPAPGPEDFHKTVVREIEEWNACVKTQGKAKCVRLYNPQQVGGGGLGGVKTQGKEGKAKCVRLYNPQQVGRKGGEHSQPIYCAPTLIFAPPYLPLSLSRACTASSWASGWPPSHGTSCSSCVMRTTR